MLNKVVYYKDGQLYMDSVPLSTVADAHGTPTYVYSLGRVLYNHQLLKTSFAGLATHIHYSAKANANMHILRALVDEGAGVDAVSAGEIRRAIAAGASPENIVFAGVGKTPEELRYALSVGVGWFNVENVDEVRLLNVLAGELDKRARVALRYNPDVKANTHPHIATGHKAAKFGLNYDDLRQVLSSRESYPHLDFEGIHVHVGSQLGDTKATVEAVRLALEAVADVPTIRTLNMGGGFPVAYTDDATLPAFTDFADAVSDMLIEWDVILEPGRSIVADAGVLLGQVLYTKAQGGETLYILDASMTELMRPALYDAHHAIVPLRADESETRSPVTVVGPVCETTDVLGRAPLPPMVQGDGVAILDAGAYGMVMSNTYNQRPRPAEVVIDIDGETVMLSRRRETYDDLMRFDVP